MTINIEKVTDIARGYFDRVEHIGGNLVIDGWMLVPTKRVDRYLLYIDKQFVREFDVVDKADVAKVFPFIPHARSSGFTISEKNAVIPDRLAEICIVAMKNGKKIGKMQTCYSKKADDKLIVRDKRLMHRVAHTESVSFFRASGFKSFYDFWELACKHADPNDLKTVLDWGCGCGRMIELFELLTENKELYGCDIDQEPITWCMNNLKNVKFNVISPLPPTNYPDNWFDLVVGNSVFTHLTQNVQFLWLDELNRIIKKDGLLLATVHGEYAAYFQFRDKAESILKDGIYDEGIDDTLGDIVPKGYYRGTFQSKEYTIREFGKYFDVLDYIEAGSLNFQDIVVMQKKDRSKSVKGITPNLKRNRIKKFIRKYLS
jgi:2-polyprenyl-3-methyl-5-hydroxy-6-metoxy-1,4-benzoquinol methylase